MKRATCRRCAAEFEHDQVRRLVCDDCKRAINNAQAAKWTRANPARRQRLRRESAARHPDTLAAARLAWYEAHRELWPGYKKASRQRHPETHRSEVRRRKARLLGAQVVAFTSEQLRQRLAYFGGRCWICGGEADQIDHVKPIAKGGAHMLCNLRPACGPCNGRKSDTWPLHASRSATPAPKDLPLAPNLVAAE